MVAADARDARVARSAATHRIRSGAAGADGWRRASLESAFADSPRSHRG
jgi:hypothetical protein